MHKLYIFLLLIWSTNAIANDIELKTGQSIVIAGAGRHDFLFEEIFSSRVFTVRGGKKYKYKYFVVDSGNYYLKSIDPIFSNVENLNFEKPDNNSRTFQIPEGKVVYLGDWIIDNNQELQHVLTWNIKRDYSYKFLKKIWRRNESLSSFPLVISNEEGKMISVSWNDI